MQKLCTFSLFYNGHMENIASKLRLTYLETMDLSERARTIILNNSDAMWFLIKGMEAYEEKRKDQDEQGIHFGEEAEG